MIAENRKFTDDDIVDARKKLFHGLNDLGTEQALKWCVVKHPHPLNEVVVGCRWCQIERKALEAVHCASRAANEEWWKELMAIAKREKDEIFDEIGSFSFNFVQMNLPDGRWWYARPIDKDAVNSPGWGWSLGDSK